MTEKHAQLEAILFLLIKPVSMKKLAQLMQTKESEIEILVQELAIEKNVSDSGIHVLVADHEVSLGTNPSFVLVLQSISKEEMQADLTSAQLETLTIVAYRGPITKAEIEYIRGVNCSIILRNLLMRGLIEEREDTMKITSVFALSTDMLKSLGVHDVSELPDYSEFHKNVKIDQLIESISENQTNL